MHLSNISLQHVATVKTTTTHISTTEVDNTQAAGADQLPPNPTLHPAPKILRHRSSSICPGAVNPCIFGSYATLPFLVKSHFKEQGREHPGMTQTGRRRTAPLRLPPAAKRFGQAWQAPQHARRGLQVSKATKCLGAAVTRLSLA